MLPESPKSIEQLDDRITHPSDAVLEVIAHCEGDIAVLGAGGKMGFHLCRMLQKALEKTGRENRLSAVSRFSTAESRRPFEQAGISMIAADLSEPDQIAKIPSIPNIFYLAGVKFGTADNADLLHRMNVLMPTLVADHFSESRIVALSTGCVYSFTSPESGGAIESDPTDPPGDYAQSCVGREQAFIAGSHARGTRCALVRLNYAIDMRYGVLVDIARQVHDGNPVNVETGFVNVIWQGDAIEQIVRCLPLVDSPPFLINVTGSETLRVREIAERFGACFDRSPIFEGNEASTCWLNNNSLAQQRFGPPPTSVETMIDWIADWTLRGGATLGKPTHFQNRDGNY